MINSSLRRICNNFKNYLIISQLYTIKLFTYQNYFSTLKSQNIQTLKILQSCIVQKNQQNNSEQQFINNFTKKFPSMIQMKIVKKFLDDNADLRLLRDKLYLKLAHQHLSSSYPPIKISHKLNIVEHYSDKISFVIVKMYQQPNYLSIWIQIIASNIINLKRIQSLPFNQKPLELPTFQLKMLINSLTNKKLNCINIIRLCQICYYLKLDHSYFLKQIYSFSENFNIEEQNSLIIFSQLFILHYLTDLLKKDLLKKLLIEFKRVLHIFEVEKILFCLENIYTLKDKNLNDTLKQIYHELINLIPKFNSLEYKYKCIKLNSHLKIIGDYFYKDILINQSDYEWIIKKGYNKRLVIVLFKNIRKKISPKILQAIQQSIQQKIQGYIWYGKYYDSKEIRNISKQLSSILKNKNSITAQFIYHISNDLLKIAEIFLNGNYLTSTTLIFKILACKRLNTKAELIVNQLNKFLKPQNVDIIYSIYQYNITYKLNVKMKYNIFQIDYETFFQKNKNNYFKMSFFSQICGILLILVQQQFLQCLQIFNKISEYLKQYLQTGKYNFQVLSLMIKVFATFTPQNKQSVHSIEQNFIVLFLKNKCSFSPYLIKDVLNSMQKFHYQNLLFIKLLDSLLQEPMQIINIVQQYVNKHMNQERINKKIQKKYLQ